MAQARRIKFKKSAATDPLIQTAMLKEGMALNLESDVDGNIDHFDNNSDNYPYLRKALEDGNYPYDVYQQRHNEGDHTYWKHFRNGVTTGSNYGQVDADEEPPTDLRLMP